MHLLVTKTEAESKGGWDFFRIIRTIPADERGRPLAAGGCPLVKS